MEIKTSQRIFITGRSGTGKSVLVESLLNLYPRVVFHDWKCECGHLKNNGYILATNPKDMAKILMAGKNRVLYQPVDPSTEDFDLVCNMIFSLTNCALVIDEAQNLCSASRIPHYYSQILRLGRSRNVGCVSLTQRPKEIHSTIISEANFIIMFGLNLEDDRRKVMGTVGKTMKLPSGVTVKTEDVWSELQDFHFLLYDGKTLVKCSPIPYKGGR